MQREIHGQKADMSKTYNRVEWSFIEYFLRRIIRFYGKMDYMDDVVYYISSIQGPFEWLT